MREERANRLGENGLFRMFQHFHINLIFLQNEDSPLSFVGTNTLQLVSKKEEMVIEKEQVIASGKSSLDVLNLTTNDANKAILEPSIDFPLSNDECFSDLCDKQQQQQQQQQQRSLFSQASWGRLEMKPERNKFKVQAH